MYIMKIAFSMYTYYVHREVCEWAIGQDFLLSIFIYVIKYYFYFLNYLLSSCAVGDERNFESNI